MPLYEYECEACGRRFEVIQRFSDSPIETCQICGAPVHKLLSAPAIQFKGTGWYVTDYAKKGRNGDDRQASTSNGKSAQESTAPAAATTPTTPSTPSSSSKE
jgi:putative FmdB family regulatory protein